MNFRSVLIIVFLVVKYSSSSAQYVVYKDSTKSIELRVKDLLSRMTLEEKVGQLSKMLGWDMYTKKNNTVVVSEKLKDVVKKQNIGFLWATLRADPWTQKTLETGLSPVEAAIATNAIQRYAVDSTRLGIPLFFSEEAPHGHMAIGATVFPTAIGQASTWNPSLINSMAKVIAKETYAVGGKNGYGPVLDLVRDPRWSRTEESYGEDPYLVSRMGEAVVLGFQGDHPKSKDRIISTLKHFVAYGMPEGGHNGGAVSVGERALRQSYLVPFERAAKVGAGSVMTAYNSVDGIPCSSNPWLLNDVLRQEWKFNGFVVSDLLSISGLKSNHSTAVDGVDAASQSINAGLDVDLSAIGYDQNLLLAVQKGFVSIHTLDQAVSRVLRQKFEIGLFDKPYVNVDEVINKVGTTSNIKLANQVAKESIVLLKNDNNLLPLSKKLNRILVVGPNADNIYNQLGDYTAPQSDKKVITVLEGIKKVVSNTTEVAYVKGCAIRDISQSNIKLAVDEAKQSDVVVVVLGGSSARDFKTSYQSTGAANVSNSLVGDMESGEGFDRSSLDMLGDQLLLLQEIRKTGKPVVLVTIQGRPLNLNWAADNISSIVNAWYPGQEGGAAIAEVLFGEYNPGGRLPISFPKTTGQLPIYYNYNKPKQHDYVEVDAKPLYSFGFGLSYSDFDYSNLSIDLKENSIDFVCSISFDVKNISKVSGDEVVQVYIVDEVSSVVTPIKSLKRFERRFIEAGDKQKFHFQISKDDLKLWNKNNSWITEGGKYKLLVGKSSDNILLEADFNLSKDYKLE